MDLGKLRTIDAGACQCLLALIWTDHTLVVTYSEWGGKESCQDDAPEKFGLANDRGFRQVTSAP